MEDVLAYGGLVRGEKGTSKKENEGPLKYFGVMRHRKGVQSSWNMSTELNKLL